jgi:hypothetical protein
MKHVYLVYLSLLWAGTAFAQCAPGIPSAGNPGCIPPNQPNSPYYQGNANVDSEPAPPPPVRWGDRWGAISIDPTDSKAGSSVNQTSERSAKKRSMDICAEDGGRQCKVVLTFVNQCAAIAVPTENGSYSTATAADSTEAESRALTRCSSDGSSCKVIYSECSLPVRIQ